ncbi:peptidylglycine alpha-hydroxylating monooxygenase [Diachasma alloeum]|uniref:peptidylglycine alpha-hydroxylating monooxygenase n=1 Tax=Diachasma alloeum TaxID=454923 RepID=UPI000738115B|nr:peptidylglycine alpha-hydroxylating monooxygenase [Diachasma alloeum]
MKEQCRLATIVVTVALLLQKSQCYSVERYSLLMPDVKPNIPELYLCTPVKMNSTSSYYIVGFEPNATMNTAHHMILYGCKKPGAAKPVWNCGEMSQSSNDLDTAGPCSDGSEILYAWARDAPDLILPEGVGFKVGGDSPIEYLVLQVHYAHVDHFRGGKTDDSGIFLRYTRQPMSKLAGVFVLGTAGGIPAWKAEKMETACTLKENKTIHPIAYRTHTHSLGKVVAGYVIRNNSWVELGKRDPLTPQMFYPVHNNMPITKGDTLAARCTMQSNRPRWTSIGSTGADEMCNFYLMYYVDSGEPLNMKYCFSEGPPAYYWKSAGFVNIPDIEASSL